MLFLLLSISNAASSSSSISSSLLPLRSPPRVSITSVSFIDSAR
eukprot:UN06136